MLLFIIFLQKAGKPLPGSETAVDFVLTQNLLLLKSEAFTKAISPLWQAQPGPLASFIWKWLMFHIILEKRYNDGKIINVIFMETGLLYHI